MKPKMLCLALYVAGTLLPYSQFVPFLREHGLDLRMFVEQLFSNRIGAFFGLDVIVSSVVQVRAAFGGTLRDGMERIAKALVAAEALARLTCRANTRRTRRPPA